MNYFIQNDTIVYIRHVVPGAQQQGLQTYSACFCFLNMQTNEALTSCVNSLSVALRAGYLSVRTAEGASEKQSSLKACLRNGLTYLLT